VLTSAVVARRVAIQAVHGFDARIRRGQDWDMWLRMAHSGVRMIANSAPLVWRTVRRTNLSGDGLAELRRAMDVLECIPRKIRLSTAELGVVHQRLVQLQMQIDLELGKRALASGDLVTARTHFQRTSSLGGWKVRCVSMGIRMAPRLLRLAYLRARPGLNNLPDITSAA
jgi:hypothetical protein